MEKVFSKQWGTLAPYQGTSLLKEADAIEVAKRALAKGKIGTGENYAAIYDKGEEFKYRYSPIVAPRDLPKIDGIILIQ